MTGRVHPVILCGGSGMRLWPVSRRAYPKQFADLFAGGSLFQRTLGRVSGHDVEGEGFAPPLLLTNEDFRFIVAEQATAAGTTAPRVVIEPEGRNTAPAVCVAARLIADEDPEGLLLVLPSDHLLADPAASAPHWRKARLRRGRGTWSPSASGRTGPKPATAISSWPALPPRGRSPSPVLSRSRTPPRPRG